MEDHLPHGDSKDKVRRMSVTIIPSNFMYFYRFLTYTSAPKWYEMYEQCPCIQFYAQAYGISAQPFCGYLHWTLNHLQQHVSFTWQCIYNSCSSPYFNSSRTLSWDVLLWNQWPQALQELYLQIPWMLLETSTYHTVLKHSTLFIGTLKHSCILENIVFMPNISCYCDNNFRMFKTDLPLIKTFQTVLKEEGWSFATR